ncbi:MAG: hypothetical protein AB7S38_07865 [Vulcanimicrobiota bacterium]
MKRLLVALCLFCLVACTETAGQLDVTSDGVSGASLFRVDVWAQEAGLDLVEGQTFSSGDTMSFADVPSGRWSVLVQAQDSSGTTISHFRTDVDISASQTTTVHAGPFRPGLPDSFSQNGFNVTSFGANDAATLVAFFPAPNNTDGAIPGSLSVGEATANRGQLTRVGYDESSVAHRCLPAELMASEMMACNQAIARGQANLRSEPQRFEELAQGDTQDFFIVTSGQTVTCQKMLAEASTLHCVIFAELVNGTPVLSTANAQAIANAFDSNNPFGTGGIYDRVHEVFGSEWSDSGGRDGDDKIVLVYLSSSSIGGSGLFGFFRPSDELAASSVSTSNEGEILYLNADKVSGDLFDSLATLAHEFQHMCHYNQKVAQNGTFPAGAVADEFTFDEGLAILSEQLNGFTLEAASGGNNFMFRSVQQFLADPDQPFFTFASRLRDYGAGYLLMRYLHDREGVAAVTAFATSTQSGRAGFTAATGIDFQEFFADWCQTNLVNDLTSGPDDLHYDNLSLTGNFTIRDLGNSTLPGLTIDTVKNPPLDEVLSLSFGPWAPTYVRFEGGDGSSLTLELSASTVELVSNLVVESPAGTYSSTQ